MKRDKSYFVTSPHPHIFVMFWWTWFSTDNCHSFGYRLCSSSVPLLVDLFLHSYEADFIQVFLKNKIKLARSFNFTFRYIDDVLSLNNSLVWWLCWSHLSHWYNYLCKVKMLSNASCNCGAPCGNSHHFFFDCDKYTDNREILFNSLNWLPSNINIDVNLLKKESDLLTYQENMTIFKHAFKYIKDSKRMI